MLILLLKSFLSRLVHYRFVAAWIAVIYLHMILIGILMANLYQGAVPCAHQSERERTKLFRYCVYTKNICMTCYALVFLKSDLGWCLSTFWPYYWFYCFRIPWPTRSMLDLKLLTWVWVALWEFFYRTRYLPQIQRYNLSWVSILSYQSLFCYFRTMSSCQALWRK